jgi:hypothetical protein
MELFLFSFFLQAGDKGSVQMIFELFKAVFEETEEQTYLDFTTMIFLRNYGHLNYSSKNILIYKWKIF